FLQLRIFMKRLATLMLGSALLFGCASHTPNFIALSPELPAVTPQTSLEPALALQTLDTRTANFIVRFNEDGKAARLVSPAEPPRAQLDQLFRQGFAKAGYRIDPASGKEVQLQLIELLTDVDESSFGFEAKTNVSINLLAKNSSHTLTKRYKAKGLLKGPFSADFASLELDMNKLITQLSGEILNDPELHSFLQQ
ncbi:MAG: YajG family lipoprotein, partial [Shewanella algae]